MVAWAGKTRPTGSPAAFAIAASAGDRARCASTNRTSAERAPIFASIGEGLRFVFGHQILLGALALDMFAVLFGGAVALLPAFIKDVLHAGPEALGILRGAPAAGAVLVGLWLSRKPLEKNAGRLLLLAVAGFGLCIIGFALSTAPVVVGGAVVRRRAVRRRLGGAALDDPAARHARMRCAGACRPSTASSSARRTNSVRSNRAWPRNSSASCRR